MKSQDKERLKIQTISITLGSILVSMINGIVGYIAVYFFKPVWEKLARWWHEQ
jgi:hypothetical protein